MDATNKSMNFSFDKSRQLGALNASMRSRSPRRNSMTKEDREAAKANPRTSIPVDMPDPIHSHLDPISVSLQERVKFGGHITSVTKRPYKKIPFYFQLEEKNAEDHVGKRAIFASMIEFEEARDKTEKVHTIKKELVDKKAQDRDYRLAVQVKEIQRIEAE